MGLILEPAKVLNNDENRSFQKWHEEIKGGFQNTLRKELNVVPGQD